MKVFSLQNITFLINFDRFFGVVLDKIFWLKTRSVVICFRRNLTFLTYVEKFILLCFFTKSSVYLIRHTVALLSCIRVTAALMLVTTLCWLYHGDILKMLVTFLVFVSNSSHQHWSSHVQFVISILVVMFARWKWILQ